ncbi:MAG: hypothetical protein RMJ87_02640 [Cytophagales bacterium]|nr:hypothetical protein [Bernardetiaceae bacterium]MDW8203903.1 hypothetical protein [Cytophagales bacterium]
MLSPYRQTFNQKFTQARYNTLLADINAQFGFEVAFKICETPIFIPPTLQLRLQEAGETIWQQVNSEYYRREMHRAIPPHLFVPHDTDMPDFAAIDFAISKDHNGELIPQLIELQGFPSLFCFQHFIAGMFRKHYELPHTLTHFFPAELQQNEELYIEKLRHAIVADATPENTILLEITPEKQKTRIDFACTERFLGVKPVCITAVRKEGKKLYYKQNGKKIWIERIYNRVIFDELSHRTDLSLHFNFTDELEVQWAGHPNWFFKMSKFTLPFLDSRYVPQTHFLHEIATIPNDLENYVLKPLFSFAGAGVKFDVTRADIDAIPDNQRSNYILMRKVQYEPVIETLDQPAKAEVRLLFVRVNGKMELLTNLVRLSKGKMMGVDFNKGMTWVGGTIGFFERQAV